MAMIAGQNVAGFAEFSSLIKDVEAIQPTEVFKKLATEEFLRFHSIAGTILENFQSSNPSAGERNITHVLLRSLLEKFFWITYIFWEDDKNTQNARFGEYLNSFKIEYKKMFDEPDLPSKSLLEAPDQSWSSLPKSSKDIKSVLAQLRNDSGDRLDYLYFAYRITSFDTHGKASKVLLEEAFGKEGINFPYLKTQASIDLIANQYLEIWEKHLKPPP